MPQNIGTLITSPIRPNDSLDQIAVVFTNEAKGGHHVYSSLEDRNSIIQARRDWGMLVTIYNDATASNNKTYQLAFSYSSSDINDNSNWISFASGSDLSGSGSEWLNSVISRTSSIPASNENGDRYLIIGTISGSQSITPANTWDGYVDAVAQYSSTIAQWNFSFPTDGTTLRVKDEINTLYKYSGIYGSGGSWIPEYINQVFFITATSSNGIDYTAYADVTTYTKPAVFYTSFATSSVGPSASLKINNLDKVTIKKISGNALEDIGSDDLNTSVEYQLIYDGNYFQTPLLSAVNQIGPAEQPGGYLNGLYTDFTTTTTIGTPIDRFNQILKSLVPPSAPTLRAWNGSFSSSGDISTGVGKLSFPYTGADNYNQATASPYGNVFVNETWNYGATADGGLYRLGIVSNFTSTKYNVDLFGTLNYNVATQSSTPVPAYSRGSFGNGNSGYLIMQINGLTVSTLSLTYSLLATNSTIGFTKPGFSVSTATSSKFSGGDPFELFYNRVGNWYLPKSCLNGPFVFTNSTYIGLTANQFGITRGYNYVTINHNINGSDNILNKIEFVLDDNTNYPSYTNTAGSGNFATRTVNATKTISGITYITNLLLIYQTDISDMYAYTYYTGSDAIQWSENYTQGNSQPTMTNIITPADISSQSLPSISSNITLPYSVTRNINITAASKRRINDPISVYISRLIRPVNITNFSSSYAPATITGVVLDTFSTNSTYNVTTQLEPFDDEARRLQTGGSYDTISSLSNLFVTSTSLQSDPGLQVYNGRLYYPTLNWSSYGDSTSNPNNGVATTNYTLCNGTRTYYRLFYLDTATRTSRTFTLNLQGSTTVVRMSATPTTGQIQISVKLPLKTAWCDALSPYSSDGALGTDGGGCFDGTPIATLAITNTNINLNFGGYGTSNSSGYVVIRITAPSGWTGYLDSMQLTYN